MLFEFSIAKKYLIPKKKQLSLSLIAVMSVAVISLVVWLVLVFLSVTDGIEKNWLKKLTSFNAPIQITPTDAYYQSYYYQVDGISNQSDYTYKSIGEKATALLTDPYLPDEDITPPSYWPDKDIGANGTTKDLVKQAFLLIDSLKPQRNGVVSQDYEISGALLKLRMVRPQGHGFSHEGSHTQSHLTQASYINSFSSKSPHFQSLIETPRIEDLNHLFYLSELSEGDVTAEKQDQSERGSITDFRKRLVSLLDNVTIKRVKNSGQKASYLAPLLPQNTSFQVLAYQKQGRISYLIFSEESKKKTPYFEKGTLKRKNDKLIYTSSKGTITEMGLATPLFVENPLSMEASLQKPDIEKINTLRDLRLSVHLTLQGHVLAGTIPWESIEIQNADIKTTFEKAPLNPPLWTYRVGNIAVLPKSDHAAAAVLLPKSFQANKTKIGDSGYFSYNASTASAVQEQRLPLTVVGFYDPGVMAIGARMILTDSAVVHTINSASQSFSFDQNMMNGIQLWFSDLSETKDIQKELSDAFEQAGILPYWNITPYYEYSFAKDLLQQFQSDKYLFTLIGVILLLVACSNIISLLVILVNDKKREIAILCAMGASKKSIAWIFTLCGGIMGTMSTLIGTAAALLTIHNIDAVVHFLSFLQGHEAFNAVFYGNSLPDQLSERAVMFILIATPIISLLAGLVPALKASKVHPSKILRSE